jgi:hypothetical protein
MIGSIPDSYELARVVIGPSVKVFTCFYPEMDQGNRPICTLAVDAIRQTMRGHLAAQVRQSMQHERSEQLRLRATADWTEGVAAMQARRSPNFEGR